MQGLQILICDFVYVMKLVEIGLFNMYCDVETRFFPPHHFFFFLSWLIIAMMFVLCVVDRTYFLG